LGGLAFAAPKLGLYRFSNECSHLIRANERLYALPLVIRQADLCLFHV